MLLAPDPWLISIFQLFSHLRGQTEEDRSYRIGPAHKTNRYRRQQLLDRFALLKLIRFKMADLESSQYYSSEASSELMNRPYQRLAINGQASFLGLAVRLGIPIFSSWRNIDIMSLPTVAGIGGFCTVSRFDSPFQPTEDSIHFVNVVQEDWFKSQPTTDDGKKKLRYALKRLFTSSDKTDAQHLACIANEVRVLSNKTLRQSPNIATLFAISWFECPDQGRYWPQVLIDFAQHGTLDSYLGHNSPAFLVKHTIGLEILAGLNYLHIHGITHCDMKPENILIFDGCSPGSELTGALGLQSKPITVKLSDFGCAVIHSDYTVNAPFQAKIGTFPWGAPELEQIPSGLPVSLDMLHTSDIYSFGLVMANVYMKGSPLFQALRQSYHNELSEALMGEVMKIKLAHDSKEVCAYNVIWEEVRAQVNMSSIQEEFIRMLLIMTLQPRPEDRISVYDLYTCMKWEIYLEAHALNDAPSGEDKSPQMQYVVPPISCETFIDSS